MAAQLSLSDAVVVCPDGTEVVNVMAIVRDNTLRLCPRIQGRACDDRPGVVAVEVQRRDRHWLIRMDNGDVYDVKNAGKAACSACS